MSIYLSFFLSFLTLSVCLCVLLKPISSLPSFQSRPNPSVSARGRFSGKISGPSLKKKAPPIKVFQLFPSSSFSNYLLGMIVSNLFLQSLLLRFLEYKANAFFFSMFLPRWHPVGRQYHSIFL